MAWRLSAVLILGSMSLPGQTSATATETLSVSISAIGKVSVPASVGLLTSGATFSPFTGTLMVSHRVRTTVGGSAAITVTASSEFSPAGGPSVASGAVTYTCSGATAGTACTGSQTLSASFQTPVLSLGSGMCTGGGGSCTSADPNTVSLAFSLTNNPGYHTGTYTAQLTFSISAV